MPVDARVACVTVRATGAFVVLQDRPSWAIMEPYENRPMGYAVPERIDDPRFRLSRRSNWTCASPRTVPAIQMQSLLQRVDTVRTLALPAYVPPRLSGPVARGGAEHSGPRRANPHRSGNYHHHAHY
jgi:hypothetical protein